MFVLDIFELKVNLTNDSEWSLASITCPYLQWKMSLALPPVFRQNLLKPALSSFSHPFSLSCCCLVSSGKGTAIRVGGRSGGLAAGWILYNRPSSERFANIWFNGLAGWLIGTRGCLTARLSWVSLCCTLQLRSIKQKPGIEPGFWYNTLRSLYNWKLHYPVKLYCT